MTGVKGEKGSWGLPGSKGEKGDQGAQGPPGIPTLVLDLALDLCSWEIQLTEPESKTHFTTTLTASSMEF